MGSMPEPDDEHWWAKGLDPKRTAEFAADLVDELTKQADEAFAKLEAEVGCWYFTLPPGW
jgi:hypothetical protein